MNSLCVIFILAKKKSLERTMFNGSFHCRYKPKQDHQPPVFVGDTTKVASCTWCGVRYSMQTPLLINLNVSLIYFNYFMSSMLDPVQRCACNVLGTRSFVFLPFLFFRGYSSSTRLFQHLVLNTSPSYPVRFYCSSSSALFFF